MAVAVSREGAVWVAEARYTISAIGFTRPLASAAYLIRGRRETYFTSYSSGSGNCAMQIASNNHSNFRTGTKSRDREVCIPGYRAKRWIKRINDHSSSSGRTVSGCTVSMYKSRETLLVTTIRLA